MSKQIHFVVYYDTETGKFVIDGDTMAVNFPEGTVFDDDTQEWERVTDSTGEDKACTILRNMLGVHNGDGLTYIAADGNYGDAGSLAIVDTTDWTDEDWGALDEESDWNRPETARLIADQKARA